VSSAKRDEIEAKFFSQGIWSKLSPTQLGITSLRIRLSIVLKDQILAQLPSLLQDVETGMKECDSTLDRLGKARTTAGQQREYLWKIGDYFSKLVKQACDGDYSDDFFVATEKQETESTKSTQPRIVCLRAVVQNRFEMFSNKLHKSGKKHEIVDRHVQSSEKKSTKLIGRVEYAKLVKEKMRSIKGRELPGLFNPLIVGELFQDQCQNWPRLTESFLKDLMQEVADAIGLILNHVAVDETKQAIFRELVRPAMLVIEKNLKEKSQELLKPYLTSHPITYNDYLIQTIFKVQSERKREQLKKALQAQYGTNLNQHQNVNLERLLASLTENVTQAEMDAFATDMAIDYMEAYYKVLIALRT
jgi:hypothetical protein